MTLSRSWTGGDGRGRLEIAAPWDGAPIEEVAAATAADADAALGDAVRLFRDRDARLPLHRRIEILDRAARIMEGRIEELAREAAREGGKPLRDSRVEAVRAIDGVRICAETLRTQAGREVPMGLTPSSGNRLAFTHREPVGPVVAVSAFNHPLNLIVHQVAPAVAVGCPVIVKPAEDTPLSCLRFVSILREAGLPEAWCRPVVTADHAVAQALVTDPRVAFFSFIGSPAVGWMLRSKLAPGARCSLEHGGVAPVHVAADADLDDAVPLLAKGGFYHAGQVCVSVQRVFADRRIAAEVAERLANAASAMRVGDPLLETSDVGPLIRSRETGRIEEWVREAVAAGARVAGGGRRIGASCFEPTVLCDPPDSARVSRLEVFGPVVCVYAVDSIDEAVARANSLPYAFQAAVFTRDLGTALRAWRRFDASTVLVNDHTAFRTDWMPFAGLRQSGHGVGGIPATMLDLQFEKMLVVRSREI